MPGIKYAIAMGPPTEVGGLLYSGHLPAIGFKIAMGPPTEVGGLHPPREHWLQIAYTSQWGRRPKSADYERLDARPTRPSCIAMGPPTEVGGLLLFFVSSS